MFNEETIETIAKGRSPREIGEELHRLGVTHVYVDWHEIDLSRQRPAQNVFSTHVEQKLEEIRSGKLNTIDITKKKRARAEVVAAE